MIGSAKAAVLPVPVCAWAIMSAPAQHLRDRARLDRRRLFVAELADRPQRRLAQPKVFKTNWLCIGHL